MKRAMITILALTFAHMAAGQIFEENFDDQQKSSGDPERFSVYGRELTDRGITREKSKSGKKSAYISADFSKSEWGVIMIRDFGEWDLVGARLSVAVCASENLSRNRAVVGFKIVDADGTGYRTAPQDLGHVKDKWTVFSQETSALVPDDDLGDIQGLDLMHIAQYAVIFYDRQDYDKEITFFIDDFNAVTSSGALE